MSSPTPPTLPPGFTPHTRHSPLTAPWEPIFARSTADSVQLAVQIGEPHCNSRGFAHGGLISALADNAMGLSAVVASQAGGAVTVGLTLDFMDSAAIGEWLEFRPVVLKTGRTLAFTECRVVCGERLVAHATATFRMQAKK